MSIIARQSTARTVMVGPVLDADGVAVTGGVVGDFKISKNGAAPGALDGSATLTHRHTGFYSLALTANDLDTVGSAQVTIDDTTNACPMANITVVEEAIYDALYAASATGLLPANVTQFGGTNGTFSSGRPEVNTTHWGGTAVASANVIIDGAITSAKFAAGAITAAAIADGAIDAATFAADVDAEILSYIVDDATRIDASALNTASVTTVPAINTKIGTPTDLDGGGATLAGNTTDIINYVDTTGQAILAAIPSAAANADAVWDEDATGHQTQGTFGQAIGDPGADSSTIWGLANTNLDAAVSTRATPAQVATELATYDGPTNAEMEARTLASANYATSSALATAQADLDILTGADGVTLATSQPNYAPATAAALSALQTDVTQIKNDLPTRPTKNTALANFPFVMRLTSDHVTGATGKTVTATRSLDGAAFGACANSVTEVANGVYKISLAAADLNADTVTLRFTATDCDDTIIVIATQP